MDRRTALLVIDMQMGFLSPRSAQCIAGAEATVPACAAVIKNCRERGIPVFFVVREYRGDGSDVEHTRYDGWLKGGRAVSRVCAPDIGMAMPEDFGPEPGDHVIIKPRFSAFFHTELDLILRRLRIDTVLLSGTTTPNCIRATCYDGISLEYNVAVLSDCTSSVTGDIQRANLLDMKNVGAQILSSAEFISGTPLTDTAGLTQSRVRPDGDRRQHIQSR